MSSQAFAPALVIRKCCSNDVQEMLPLMRQLCYPTTPSVLKEHLSMLDKHPQECSLIAEMDGHVVGTTFLKLYQTHDMAKPVTRITAMIVDEEHRLSGIGKRLLQEAEKWSKEQGSSRLYLSYGEHNSEARAFYERLGYTCTGYRLSKNI
ncbi:GNAT family N-acetyltransferase [Paenibacillus turicensis]|uniref:GNAT family N-acetyltransferase n=1 Tax=Paenibacillus turicensis TaxID=160487 RepID=UPI003D2DD937